MPYLLRATEYIIGANYKGLYEKFVKTYGKGNIYSLLFTCVWETNEYLQYRHNYLENKKV